MPAIAQQCESVEESFRRPRNEFDVGLHLRRIVNELRETIVADVKAEVIGRDILEIVRFIEDDRAVVRQDRSHIIFEHYIPGGC